MIPDKRDHCFKRVAQRQVPAQLAERVSQWVGHLRTNHTVRILWHLVKTQIAKSQVCLIPCLNVKNQLSIKDSNTCFGTYFCQYLILFLGTQQYLFLSVPVSIPEHSTVPVSIPGHSRYLVLFLGTQRYQVLFLGTQRYLVLFLGTQRYLVLLVPVSISDRALNSSCFYSRALNGT